MLHQIRRRLRHTHALEVCGQGYDPSRALADLAGSQRGVAKLAHAERNINACFDQVDVLVVEDKLDIELRMLGEEGRQARDHVQAGEGHRPRDAQVA